MKEIGIVQDESDSENLGIKWEMTADVWKEWLRKELSKKMAKRIN